MITNIKYEACATKNILKRSHEWRMMDHSHVRQQTNTSKSHRRPNAFFAGNDVEESIEIAFQVLKIKFAFMQCKIAIDLQI